MLYKYIIYIILCVWGVWVDVSKEKNKILIKQFIYILYNKNHGKSRHFRKCTVVDLIKNYKPVI